MAQLAEAIRLVSKGDTQPLPRCLNLWNCETLTALAGLRAIEHLSLNGCTGLLTTQGLPPLPALKTLFMQNCTGLAGESALQGLAGLDKLEHLDLKGCTGLTEAVVGRLRDQIGKHCNIYGWPSK